MSPTVMRRVAVAVALVTVTVLGVWLAVWIQWGRDFETADAGGSPEPMSALETVVFFAGIPVTCLGVAVLVVLLLSARRRRQNS